MRTCVTFLESNTLINPTQHGFRSEGNQVDAIYLHFAKVDHNIFLLNDNLTGKVPPRRYFSVFHRNVCNTYSKLL